MASNVYEFEFNPKVEVLEEAEMTLQLAFLAVEGLLGESRVRLEGRYEVDEERRSISIDGATEVGESAVRIYTGLLIREIGADGFSVRRPQGSEQQHTPATAEREPAAAEAAAA